MEGYKIKKQNKTKKNKPLWPQAHFTDVNTVEFSCVVFQNFAFDCDYLFVCNPHWVPQICNLLFHWQCRLALLPPQHGERELGNSRQGSIMRMCPDLLSSFLLMNIEVTCCAVTFIKQSFGDMLGLPGFEFLSLPIAAPWMLNQWF